MKVLFPILFLGCLAADVGSKIKASHKGKHKNKRYHAQPSLDRFDVPTVNPGKANIFSDFNQVKFDQVHDWLLTQPSLNLTAFENATISDNYIVFIEGWTPKKADVLRYLDENGSALALNIRI
jgi:hypothetical protein